MPRSSTVPTASPVLPGPPGAPQPAGPTGAPAPARRTAPAAAVLPARPAKHPRVPGGIDPRGARFAAAVTSLVLAAALLATSPVVTTALVLLQTVVFAVGALAGPRHSPYARIFAVLIRPRLGPPAELEDPAPPRFAQAVGLGFAAIALAGYLAGAPLLGAVAVGFALAAAFLNAAFDYCLGCEAFLLLRRLTPSRAASTEAAPARPAAPDSTGVSPVATKG